MEFKVGDRVRVLSGGDGVVTYGPVNGTVNRYKLYVVKQDGDEERAIPVTHLEPTQAFAVGDVVTLSTRAGARATVEYGPIDNAPVYLVKLVNAPDGHGNPRTFQALASCMTKVDDEPALVPVGTRVRVDRAELAEECHGHTGVVTSNDEVLFADEGDRHVYRVHLDDGTSVYAAEVTPVDNEADGFEYEGVTYEYGAVYQDCAGDLFRFRPKLSDDGTATPQGQQVFGATDEGGSWHWSLAEVLRDYAPLTKR